MEAIADEIQTGGPETGPLLPSTYHEGKSRSSETSDLSSCGLVCGDQNAADIPTETPARLGVARADEEDTRPASRMTMGPAARSSPTSPMAEQRSESDNPVHLAVPHVTSESVRTEETQNNFRLAHSLAGADNGLESAIESYERSTDGPGQAREVSGPRGETNADVVPANHNHNEIMQQRAQEHSNHNDRILQQFLEEAAGFLTEKGRSDDIVNADPELQPNIEMKVSGSRSESLGHSKVELAVEYYSVVRNGRRNHYIIRQDQSVPRWADLASLPHLDYRGVTYKAGDIVYILLAESKEDSCAKIREIRDLGDGRKVISVLWYFTIKDAKRYGCKTLKGWPRGKSHILASMLQVIMWDTINGLVEQTLLDRLASEKVLDVGTKTCRILNKDAKAVSWANELPNACRTQELSTLYHGATLI